MTTIPSTELPTRATCWHDESTKVVGGAITRTANASQIFCHYTAQAGPANGDSFTNGVFLRAGTYTLSWLGMTDNTQGLADWYLDGALVASGQDWYSVGATYNVIQTATVTVAFDGWHVLLGTVNGKNVASGGYALKLTKFWFQQVND